MLDSAACSCGRGANNADAATSLAMDPLEAGKAPGGRTSVHGDLGRLKKQPSTPQAPRPRLAPLFEKSAFARPFLTRNGWPLRAHACTPLGPASWHLHRPSPRHMRQEPEKAKRGGGWRMDAWTRCFWPANSFAPRQSTHQKGGTMPANGAPHLLGIGRQQRRGGFSSASVQTEWKSVLISMPARWAGVVGRR